MKVRHHTALMRSSPARDERGITLVELMISIAVLGMLTAVAASVYAFGARTFRSGESQAWLQMNMDTAVQAVVPRVRNATAIEILTLAPGLYDPDWWYLYLENPAAPKTTVAMRSPGGTEKAVTDAIVRGADGLSFSARLIGGKVVLTITMACVYGTKSRQVTTNVILGNISSLPDPAGGAAIRFKMP